LHSSWPPRGKVASIDQLIHRPEGGGGQPGGLGLTLALETLLGLNGAPCWRTRGRHELAIQPLFFEHSFW
jgi:hypothetical protein